MGTKQEVGTGIEPKSVTHNESTALLSITLKPGTYILIGQAQFEKNANGERAANVYTTEGYMSEGVGANTVRVASCGNISKTCITAINFASSNAQFTEYLNVLQNSGSTLTCDGRIIAIRLK